MFCCILFSHSSFKSPFKIKLLRIIRVFPSVVPSGMGTCGRQQAPAVQCPGSSAQLRLSIFWGLLSVWEDVVLGSIRSHWFLCTRLPTAHLHTCVCVLCLIGREWQCGRKALATNLVSEKDLGSAESLPPMPLGLLSTRLPLGRHGCIPCCNTGPSPASVSRGDGELVELCQLQDNFIS